MLHVLKILAAQWLKIAALEQCSWWHSISLARSGHVIGCGTLIGLEPQSAPEVGKGLSRYGVNTGIGQKYNRFTIVHMEKYVI